VGSTVALCMIVKDESAVIERCLRSVRPLVDTWVICDTGSTDGTPELIHSLLTDLPGQLHHRPWQDFGHNRSELMELAQGAADYLLLLDADMTVRITSHLPELTADAYLVRHDGPLGYWNPRLVRGSRRWHYVGATHEYLDAADGPHTQARLDAMLVEHHADGGSRGDKYERDRRLLEAELARDPGNPRAVFYLAQTCRDLGDRERAVELYQQRSRMGGWDEEAFYAAYQAGVLLAGTDWELAVPTLLDAWQRRPTRAEPLHALAQGYRCRGEDRLALLFAETGLPLPIPEDILFVERHVYEWGLLFEWSIAASRLGDHQGALRANERLLRRSIPEGVRRSVHHNRRVCYALMGRNDWGRPVPPAYASPDEVRRLDQLVPGTRVGEIRLDVEPDWPRLNPSIAADGDGVRMIVRTTSITFDPDADPSVWYRSLLDDGTHRSLNYLVELDRHLRVERVAPIVDRSTGVTRHSTGVRGYQDCRPFKLGGRWFATAAAGDHDADFRWQVALLAFDGDAIEHVLTLPSPDPTRHEKNWIPVVRGDELHLIYTCDPTVVLRCDVDTGRLETLVERAGPPVAAGFRGSSHGVAVDGGTLAIVHETTLIDTHPRYSHRFVLFDDDYALVGVSRAFCFASPLVEFCPGLARRDGELLISFSISEQTPYLAVVDEAAVLGLLKAP